jgi:tol-pal system protein YbgF
VQSAARFALFLARAADSFLAMKRTNPTTRNSRARAVASAADGHVRAVLMAALTGFALLTAAVVVAPLAHGQVFNSQPYTAAPDPAVEQLRQRIEQLESDLRKATDRTEVLGAQLSDARRTADEANEGRKKLEADLAALLIRVETLEDAAGGPVSAGGGSAAAPTSLQTARSVDLTGSTNNASPAPAAAAVDLAAFPQDEEGFFNSAHALLLGGDFPASQEAFTSYLAKYPKGAKAADAQYYLGESLLYQDNFADASGAYAKLIKSYPNSPNAATGMVKLARAMRGMGKTSDSCKTLDVMAKQFPKASAVAKQMAAQERQYAKCS